MWLLLRMIRRVKEIAIKNGIRIAAHHLKKTAIANVMG
jgi:hypothetical protein